MPKRQRRDSSTRGVSRRRVDVREVRQRFLIVCEGERTEPNYFRAFRAPGLVVQVEGIGQQALRLVERALELRGEREYDQVWCVFDRDDIPAEQFNRAIQLAESSGMQVAYSNEAFELWYLLHFHYYNTAITRNDYIQRLGGLLGQPYSKNSETIFDLILTRQATAIENARRLFAEYDPVRPAHDNPSTKVHLLVEALNRQRHEK